MNKNGMTEVKYGKIEQKLPPEMNNRKWQKFMANASMVKGN